MQKCTLKIAYYEKKKSQNVQKCTFKNGKPPGGLHGQRGRREGCGKGRRWRLTFPHPSLRPLWVGQGDCPAGTPPCTQGQNGLKPGWPCAQGGGHAGQSARSEQGASKGRAREEQAASKGRARENQVESKGRAWEEQAANIKMGSPLGGCTGRESAERGSGKGRRWRLTFPLPLSALSRVGQGDCPRRTPVPGSGERQ